jgi:hypothetical protein
VVGFSAVTVNAPIVESAPELDDQIGRIFAYWVKIYTMLVTYICVNWRSSPNFGANFYYGKSDVIILTKNGLGYILGDFFRKRIWSPCS